MKAGGRVSLRDIMEIKHISTNRIISIEMTRFHLFRLVLVLLICAVAETHKHTHTAASKWIVE